MRVIAALVVAASLSAVACGGAPPAPAAAPHGPAAAPERAAGQASEKAAPAATAATERPAGPTAESCEGPTACGELGLELAKKGDPSAKAALAKGCSGASPHGEACAEYVRILLDAEPVDEAALVAAASAGCAHEGAEERRPARALACSVLGILRRDGKAPEGEGEGGTTLAAFEKGCALGEPRACQAARQLQAEARARADAESGVPGANLRIGSLSVNGVKVEQIACRSDSGVGGLFGSLALAKPFADKKSKLDACVKGAPRTARVRWTARAGKMRDVKVISGDAPSNACVERALTGALATVPGTCAASVEIGRR